MPLHEHSPPAPAVSHPATHAAPDQAPPDDPTPRPWPEPLAVAISPSTSTDERPAAPACVADALTPYRPRIKAAHLVRGQNGIWNARIVVPEHIRRAHPELPKELRRSTKTGSKRATARFAREMCLDFFIRYTNPGIAMHAPDVLSNKSFFVAFAYGALKAECSSAACPDTLLLFKQTVNLLVQSVARAWRPSEDSRPDHAVAPPLTQTVTADLSSASALSGYRQSVDVRTASAPQPISPAGVHWLSDVIDDWHENGGVKFSAETWD